ncbi:MAG: hypothetical protein E7182_01850 [Erysipelotrichaceae bacterium]|nr:hypothetical protein [Erysipelotrichaceae bacterium]
MKKAILITGIIWLVLCVGGAIAELVVGFGDLVKVQSGSVTIDPNPSLAAANIALGFSLIVGAILDVILLVKRNSDMKKAPGIVLGVFAAVFGATLPGIFFAIDSGMNRSRE